MDLFLIKRAQLNYFAVDNVTASVTLFLIFYTYFQIVIIVMVIPLITTIKITMIMMTIMMNKKVFQESPQNAP